MRASAATLAVAVVCTALIGCGKSGQDLKPTLRVPTDVTSPAPASNQASALMPEPVPIAQRLMVHRIAFAWGDPQIQVALEALEDVPIDDGMRHTWRRNGLRLSRVDRDQLPLLLANLPEPLWRDVTTMQAVPHYAPIRLVDRVRGVLSVRVVDIDGTATDMRLVRGRLQMQVRVLPPLDDPTDPRVVDLLPHHYGLSTSLVPLSPSDQAFDGQTFNMLHVQQPMTDDKVWLVWADPEAISAEVEDGPQTLGRAMFSARRGTKPVQTMLMIRFAR